MCFSDFTPYVLFQYSRFFLKIFYSPGAAIGWLLLTAVLAALTTVARGTPAVALTGLVYALTAVLTWIDSAAVVRRGRGGDYDRRLTVLTSERDRTLTVFLNS
jgi:hypothetical protein